jgi:hypothetical protein
MGLLNFWGKIFKPRKKKKSYKHIRRIAYRKKRRLRPKKVSKAKPRPKAKVKVKKKPVKKIERPNKKISRRLNSVAKPVKVAKEILREKETGTVTHYFDKISVGTIKLKAPLAISSHIHIKGTQTDFTQVVSSMQYNHKDIPYARSGLEIGIKVVKPVRENDKLYLVY